MLSVRLGGLWRQPTERSSYPADFAPEVTALCDAVQPYTMTGPERIFALRQAVLHVCRNRIPGAIVECGVWKGGSMMAAAKTLMECGERRPLYLCDTFDGMPPPADGDRDMAGVPAAAAMAREDKATSPIWAYGPLGEVQSNMRSTGYPPELVHFVIGRVEETLPQAAPDEIAILRLDTDWYESTRHELEHLYPRLSVGGILIIDDYGHWQGARKAVDEYFAGRSPAVFLNRVDYTCRLVVKPAS
jgi:O-methyltransferase